MRRISLIIIIVSFISSLVLGAALADEDHTAVEEAEGKKVWEKLQTKQLRCESLSDHDFGALGEYFMGQMMGNAHESMNENMTKMMGEEGEEQMHVVMGKRMSGCYPNEQFPSGMMGMMGQGGGSNMMGQGTGMMGWGPLASSGWGWIGTLGLVFWIVLLIDLMLLGLWLWKQIQKK